MVVRPVLCRSFIGRNEELAFLNERRLEAARSRGGLTIVAGDAGIGKSRLIAEFVAPLVKSRWRVGHGACLPFAQRPYGPIVDMLVAIDGATSTLEPEATKADQFEAIFARLARAAERSAIIGIVEDIHWADSATLDLLAYLAPRLERMRAFVIATLRADECGPEHASQVGLARIARAARGARIDLAPLGDSELKLFIDEALAGIALSPETRRSVASASEGNPFFTEELLKVAVERKASDPAQTPAAVALPSTVRASLLERFRQLGAADRHVVSQAAVIGRTFDLALLARTLDLRPRELLDTLGRAREIQLVEEIGDATFRFRHALTREAIYASFLRAEVVTLHRTIATALEAERPERESLEGLAYHWWAAGEAVPTARYNELAGDAAGRLHAHEDAIAFYERALEALPPSQATIGGISEKIAVRALALGFMVRARAAYEHAAECFARVPDREKEAHCRVRAALTAYTMGDARATEPLERMLVRLDAEPGAYVARSRIHLGIAWIAASLWSPTLAAFHLASVDTRALARGGEIALRYHNVSAWVAMTIGDFPTFEREHGAWLAAATESGDINVVASAHSNGATCYALFGRHDDAHRHIAIALEIARTERNDRSEKVTLAIGAMCALYRGDLAAAKTALLALVPKMESRVTLDEAIAAGTLVGAHLDDRDLIATWFDGGMPSQADHVESACGAGLAEICMRRGRPLEAAELLARAIPACERPRGNMLTLLAAARYAEPAVVDRARSQLVAAADAPSEVPERHAVALFDAYVARRANRMPDAIERARIAAEGFRAMGFPLLEAAAREIAGETAAALALYRACGATYDERRLGVPTDVAPAEPLTNARQILSPREREIALLVAQGRSNVEIARTLAISHKTVEKHLGAVFLKLGFGSRAQLAAYVGTPAG